MALNISGILFVRGVLRLERYILSETSGRMPKFVGSSEPRYGPQEEGGHALARSDCFRVYRGRCLGEPNGKKHNSLSSEEAKILGGLRARHLTSPLMIIRRGGLEQNYYPQPNGGPCETGSTSGRGERSKKVCSCS